MLVLKIPLLDAFTNGLNNIPTTGSNLATNNGAYRVGSMFGIHLTNTEFLWLGKALNIIDMLILMGIIFGFIRLISSQPGNNGEVRASGLNIVIGFFIALVISRLAPIIGMAGTSIKVSQGLMFVFTLLSQVLFFVGTPMVFLMGCQKLMLGEMVNNAQYLDQAHGLFQWLYLLFAVGAVLYLVTEVIL